MPQATYTSSSSSYTSSTSNGTTQTSGTRSAQSSSTDASGNTTTHSAYQNSGEPAVQETRQYDAQGRELVGDSSGYGQGRIGDGVAGVRVTEVQDENDRKYLEAMEDEYAKREGGA